MIFGDPPYNVEIDGHAGGLGKAHHREFAMASGEMSSAEFTAFLTTTMLKSRSLQRRWFDSFSLHGFATPLRAAFSRPHCIFRDEEPLRLEQDQRGHGLIVSLPTRTGRCFQKWMRPTHQQCRARPKRTLRHQPLALCRLNSFRSGRMAGLQSHPTVKPVALVADAALDWSKVNGLILDPFAGSGTTILACERTKPGRQAGHGRAKWWRGSNARCSLTPERPLQPACARRSTSATSSLRSKAPRSTFTRTSTASD
jgi:DNA methylase